MDDLLSTGVALTEAMLRHWSVTQAEEGMPELVLVAFLRADVAEMEATGCVPRN